MRTLSIRATWFSTERIRESLILSDKFDENKTQLLNLLSDDIRYLWRALKPHPRDDNDVNFARKDVKFARKGLLANYSPNLVFTNLINTQIVE